MGQELVPCATTVLDIGPGIVQVVLQLLAILSIYLGVLRIQRVVEGQQANSQGKTTGKDG